MKYFHNLRLVCNSEHLQKRKLELSVLGQNMRLHPEIQIGITAGQEGLNLACLMERFLNPRTGI